MIEILFYSSVSMTVIVESTTMSWFLIPLVNKFSGGPKLNTIKYKYIKIMFCILRIRLVNIRNNYDQQLDKASVCTLILSF